MEAPGQLRLLRGADDIEEFCRDASAGVSHDSKADDLQAARALHIDCLFFSQARLRGPVFYFWLIRL